MTFAIRDDDISYFTSPIELKEAYSVLEDVGGTISLAVVPDAVSKHGDVEPYGIVEARQCKTGNNIPLVEHLREGILSGRYDILLHGYSHEYKKVNGRWVPEMIWKSEEDISNQLTEGKEYLENLLGVRISVFVAPNNSIDQRGIRAIERLKMDFSGIIHLGDREINTRYIKNFVTRWVYRSIKGIPYGALLDYGKHKEKYAYPLSNIQRLKKEYCECKSLNTPFILNTHYWDIRKEPSRRLFTEIMNYLLSDGAELVSVSSCFE